MCPRLFSSKVTCCSKIVIKLNLVSNCYDASAALIDNLFTCG